MGGEAAGMGPLTYGLIVALAAIVAGFVAYVLTGLRDLRRDDAEHARHDHEIFETKESAGARFNSLMTRLANIERDVHELRRVLAPRGRE